MCPTGLSMSCRSTGFTHLCATVILVISLLGGAAACGFQPLHSRLGGADAARLSGIKVLPIVDRKGQILSNLLRDRLTPHGTPQRPEYLLSVQLSEHIQSLGVRTDESATRANLKMTAAFTLSSAAPSKFVMRGIAESTSSFNILDSSFATLSSEKDARARSLREISDQIKTRISIFLGPRS
jgi:LPS-assembly lipoprotein